MQDQGFFDAMAAAGIPSAQALVLDGKLRRYNVVGDKKGRRNGWYRFVGVRDDSPGRSSGQIKADSAINGTVKATESLQNTTKLSSLNARMKLKKRLRKRRPK